MYRTVVGSLVLWMLAFGATGCGSETKDDVDEFIGTNDASAETKVDTGEDAEIKSDSVISCPKQAPESGGSCEGNLDCDYDRTCCESTGECAYTRNCFCDNGTWQCLAKSFACPDKPDVAEIPTSDVAERDTSGSDASSETTVTDTNDVKDGGDMTDTIDTNSLPPGCSVYLNNPDVDYTEPQKCTRINFLCSNNSKRFSNECGCGCVDGCPDSTESNVNYVADSASECTRLSWVCGDGRESFDNACGCGCRPN